MDSRIYASSATTVEPSARRTFAPNTPLSDGARPVPCAMWQVSHENCVNRRSPAAAGFTSPLSPESHAAYSAGSITVTHPPITAWFVPQYCEQKKWYLPVLVGRNHIVL